MQVKNPPLPLSINKSSRLTVGKWSGLKPEPAVRMCWVAPHSDESHGCTCIRNVPCTEIASSLVGSYNVIKCYTVHKNHAQQSLHCESKATLELYELIMR